MWKCSLQRYLVLIVVLVVTAAMQSATESVAQEAELIAVLRSDAGLQEKSAACRQLARIGTKEAVPALAELLADEELSHMARYALEPITDPSVNEALRDALGNTQGRPQLGVIGSLGVRRDTKAVEPLSEWLETAETAQAAARAIGNIGTPTAAEALQKALPNTTEDNQMAICEGLLRCAEALAAEGEPESSQAIYDELRGRSDVPPAVRAAALRGAILARGSEGIPLLVEALHGDDYGLAAAAVRAAMESPGREVTDALVTELPKTSSERKGLLILALADRGESRVLPAVLDVATSDEGPLRLLAFRALKRIGDASCVPPLLDAAAGDSDEVSQAAIESLESLQGKTVDGQIVGRISDAQGKMRQVLIGLAGQRRIAAAAPALWQAVEDPDANVRVAALVSLGNVMEPADLPKLISRLATTRDTAEAAALDQAIRDVCLRAEDQEAVAAKLAETLATADPAVKGRILDTLNIVGGTNSLAAVASAARDGDELLRDEAFRVLGSWKSADAAPLLLELFHAESNPKFKIRAVRAYIRIARQFDMPAETRAAMCRTALATATRDADKQLVLEVLLRYPSQEMQAIALEAAHDPALKDQAMLVVMGMASKGINRAELGKALAQAGQTPVELEIIKAEYGADKKIKDVTATLRKYAKSYRIIFLPSESYNTTFGGDPAQGVVKQLKIKYRIDGKEAEVTLNENATIILPLPK
ncbi:HEAT repeat domain-containing protein [Novipirellula artificiosorum]|uniref:Putative lyase n=1 Tax=Novipirellula artificiosorum TaxID=2528016 RepID=A0A5C6DE07_9BACT|nr:HEAT repeat domain-containing protein [Novipirellula artificiosorum]TWU35030.1 putative lyase [Novipirellula artificiosorum]